MLVIGQYLKIHSPEVIPVSGHSTHIRGVLMSFRSGSLCTYGFEGNENSWKMIRNRILTEKLKETCEDMVVG